MKLLVVWTAFSSFTRAFPTGTTQSHSSVERQLLSPTFSRRSSFLASSSRDDDASDDSLKWQRSSSSRRSKGAKNEGGDGTQKQHKFATGEELRNLRIDLQTLRHNWQWAQALKDEGRMESLSQAIRQGEARDPAHMYDKALRLLQQVQTMKDATTEEKDALTEKWLEIADSAKACLPQFQMEGLWVGNYGELGAQLINVTYTKDDGIIARKVTGDRNVPRGETTFTIDLSPSNHSALPPIQLFDDKSRTSGEFQRFPGRGQVSRQGFKDSRYVEGQMVLFDQPNHFGFVWIPTKHHVTFQRPTPEQTLRLLRDTISKEDELENQRNHIARCFGMDLSTCLARQHDPSTQLEPLRRISLQDELDEAQRRITEEQQRNERNIFWQIQKWRKKIDQALDG